MPSRFNKELAVEAILVTLKSMWLRLMKLECLGTHLLNIIDGFALDKMWYHLVAYPISHTISFPKFIYPKGVNNSNEVPTLCINYFFSYFLSNRLVRYNVLLILNLNLDLPFQFHISPCILF